MDILVCTKAVCCIGLLLWSALGSVDLCFFGGLVFLGIPKHMGYTGLTMSVLVQTAVLGYSSLYWCRQLLETFSLY